MIGHYLLTLTPEQEDRVLTRSFEPVAGTDCERACCLVMTATDDRNEYAGATPQEMRDRPRHNDTWRAPGHAYEVLSRRFGVERINAAIRSRILSNRARRMLQGTDATQEAISAR
jgi:hypothetical protein